MSGLCNVHISERQPHSVMFRMIEYISKELNILQSCQYGFSSNKKPDLNTLFWASLKDSLENRLDGQFSMQEYA